MLAAALLCGAGCARPESVAAPTSPATVTLAVATWNLHAGRGELRQFAYDLASGSLTGGVPNDYVILVQEDVEPSADSASTVANTRGLSSFFAPARQGSNGATGNAILSTRPLLDARAVMLERERQPRSAAAATIRLDSTSLFIVNVHMENRLGWWKALFSDTARARQAERLLAQLPATGPGILGGDLNTWLGPREPAWRMLLERFGDTPRDRPQPTFRDRLVLDHLFFDVPAGWTVTRHVVAATYGSDHHPVVGVLSGR
jgi:endonuclease/exonuclease/phosphatase family metal-dependent hydrolase